MGGGRQAWCPRCDQVRPLRPGGACPACGRVLLAVPPARPGLPPPGLADRAARRLRALAPAATAAAVALLVLAVVASAFAAGRLTRTTPSGPGSAPATTAPGFLDEGPETSRRDFNWEATAGGLTVTLRSLTVGTGFSRLELHVDGVRGRREVSALEGLRIRDRDGHDLLAGGAPARIATAASRSSPRGGIDTDVVLDRPLDLGAVATVELRGLTIARWVQEELHGALVDRELRRRLGDSFDDDGWLAQRRSCPDCRLRVRCGACGTVRITGWAYRRGRILIAVEALDRVERTALNPSRRRVQATDEAGIVEVSAWVDGSDGAGVISVPSSQLLTSLDGGQDDGAPLTFVVLLRAQAEQQVRASWTIRQAGG